MLSVTEQLSVVHVYHDFLTHLPTDGHSGISAIVNNATIDMGCPCLPELVLLRAVGSDLPVGSAVHYDVLRNQAQPCGGETPLVAWRRSLDSGQALRIRVIHKVLQFKTL